MIERTLFSPYHDAFRDAFRRFVDKEVAPFHEAWEEQGYVARELWNKAGANGYLCPTMPEEYGGAGADKLYSVIQMEELARGGFTGVAFSPAQWTRLNAVFTTGVCDWSKPGVQQQQAQSEWMTPLNFKTAPGQGVLMGPAPTSTRM